MTPVTMRPEIGPNRGAHSRAFVSAPGPRVSALAKGGGGQVGDKAWRGDVTCGAYRGYGDKGRDPY